MTTAALCWVSIGRMEPSHTPSGPAVSSWRRSAEGLTWTTFYHEDDAGFWHLLCSSPRFLSEGSNHYNNSVIERRRVVGIQQQPAAQILHVVSVCRQSTPGEY